MSYHDSIQVAAREIEKSRGKTYSQTEKYNYTEIEEMYSKGAEYKLLRARLQTRTKEKCLDDIIDAYNYCALLYIELTK